MKTSNNAKFKSDVEKYWPYVLSPLLAAACVYFVSPASYLWSVLLKLANPMVSLMAISVGFISASAGIIITGEIPIIRTLKTSVSALRKVIRFHLVGVKFGTIACGVNLILFAVTSEPQKALPVFNFFLLVINFLAVTTFLNVIHVFGLLLPQPEKPSNKQPNQTLPPS